MNCTVLGEGKFLRLVRSERWEYVERIRTCGVVVVVPLTVADELIFIEQVRAAVGRPVIEFPGGLAGDLCDLPNEELMVAAQRELLEETGFASPRLVFLAESPPTSGLTSEVMTIFAAYDARRVGAGGGVGSERITLHIVPRAEAPRWLAEQSRRAYIALPVYAGMHLLSRE
jgi:ADP-ribose pyrophosphatase